MVEIKIVWNWLYKSELLDRIYVVETAWNYVEQLQQAIWVLLISLSLLIISFLLTTSSFFLVGDL